MPYKFNPITGQFDYYETYTLPPGTGDVVGPASSTDNAVVRYDGTTGKTIQDSNVTIDDSGNIVTPAEITINGTQVRQSILDLQNSFTNLEYDQVVYVDGSNTGTYTPDGTLTRPYKTIQDMYTGVTDASSAKKYVARITPGTYTLTVGTFAKPYINFEAFGDDSVLVRVSNGVGGFTSLKLRASTPGRLFFSNIAFSHGFELINDSAGASGVVINFDNCTIAGATVINGRGGGNDFIQFRNNCNVQGALTINSAATTIYDSTLYSTLTMTDVGCIFPDSFGSAITATLRNNYLSAVTITGTDYDVYTDAWGNNQISTLTITSNSAFPCTFNADANTYPSNVVLSGSPSPVVVRSTLSSGVDYTPATPSNWSSVPVEVKEALDILAETGFHFSDTFNATSDWTGPVGDSYSMTYLKSAHGKSAPIVQMFELNGSDYIQVETGIKIDSSENVIITVNSTPDLRFAGKIIIS